MGIELVQWDEVYKVFGTFSVLYIYVFFFFGLIKIQIAHIYFISEVEFVIILIRSS